MWPTRKVAVALGAALRTKEGQATDAGSRAERLSRSIERLGGGMKGNSIVKDNGEENVLGQGVGQARAIILGFRVPI